MGPALARRVLAVLSLAAAIVGRPAWAAPAKEDAAPLDAQMLLDLDLLKEADLATERDLLERMPLLERLRLLENLRMLETPPGPAAPSREEVK